MKILLVLALATIAAQSTPISPGIHDETLPLPGGKTLTYAVSIPRGYASQAVPLVLSLHSGGARPPHYGREFMKALVQPALTELGGILVAPDCPTNAWSDPQSEAAVMALMTRALQTYTIDKSRVLVTGYSMGGSGTWFIASRHPDLFTGAIPMAASTTGIQLEQLGRIPTYVIHSRDDEVVPFAPAERTARQLIAMGRPVQFEALRQFTHFEMLSYVDALKRGGRWVSQRWNEMR